MLIAFQTRPTTTPNTKPPTWAIQATPEFGAVKNWKTNQKPSSHLAVMSRNMKKKPKKSSDRMRTFGNITRYAPMTPAMAPDAPTIGTVLLGCTTTWANVAARPAAT